MRSKILKCKICGNLRDLSQSEAFCKKCIKERKALKYLKNKEIISLKSKIYRRVNIDKIKLRSLNYRKEKKS